MYQRGDIVIFRPTEIHSGGNGNGIDNDNGKKYSYKYSYSYHCHEKLLGNLTVGVIQDVKHHYILIGNDSIEKRQELFTIHIVGSYRPTIRYPDQLFTSTSKVRCRYCSITRSESHPGTETQTDVDPETETKNSFRTNVLDNNCSRLCCWNNLRRETIANKIKDIKTQEDYHVDIAKVCSSHITDLDVNFVSHSLETDMSCIDGLKIKEVHVDDNKMYSPSIFEKKLDKAKIAFQQNRTLCTLFESFHKWQLFTSIQSKMKIDFVIIIQKNVRRFCERGTLNKQRQWRKWWHIQKHYFYDYVNPDEGVLSYNVHGTRVYFNTKVIADQWSAQMKEAIEAISVYGERTIYYRLNLAMRKWCFSISQQKDEVESMLYEDFLSSSIS